MATNKIPRGIRNNNPLNIRVGNKWKGEVSHPTDKQFEQFVSMEWGVRAAFIILRRYIQRYGLNTIARIIAKWAPTSENNTRAYVKAVATKVGISPDAQVKYEDEQLMCSIADAMIRVECGQPIDMAIIKKGYAMA